VVWQLRDPLVVLQEAFAESREGQSADLAANVIRGYCRHGIQFCFFPADTIKSKIQTGEVTNVKAKFSQVGKDLFRAHGFKGLYRGCGITVARSAPSSALIFTIYEYLRKTFG